MSQYIFKLSGIDEEDGDGNFYSTDINNCHNKLKRYIVNSLKSNPNFYEHILSNKNNIKNLKLIWDKGDLEQLIEFWNSLTAELIKLIIINPVEGKLLEVPFPID